MNVRLRSLNFTRKAIGSCWLKGIGQLSKVHFRKIIETALALESLELGSIIKQQLSFITHLLCAGHCVKLDSLQPGVKLYDLR